MTHYKKSKKLLLCYSVLACLAGVVSHVSSGVAQYNDITVQSVNSSGLVSESDNAAPSLSSTGRYLVFQSQATNLGGITDRNGVADIFLRDTQAQLTTCMSVSEGAVLSNNSSSQGAISGDGSVVVFQSLATNLVLKDDTNDVNDIFAKTIATNVITRISESALGVVGNGASINPSVSTTGQYVAFQSVATNLTTTSTDDAIPGIYVYDRTAAVMTEITRLDINVPANGESILPAISADGRYVAYVSAATNLVPSDLNGFADIFVYDRDTGITTRESRSTAGVDADAASTTPSLSSDGRYLVFASAATQLTSHSKENVGATDIFLRDRTTGTTTLVSVNSQGLRSNGNSIKPVISGDGTTVTYLSDATNLVDFDSNNTAGDKNYDVFVYTIATGAVHQADTTPIKTLVKGTATSVTIDNSGKVLAFDYSGQLEYKTSTKVQIYVVDESCTGDRDGDGALNCAEQCPDDSTKTLPGSCGCGVLQTDSDSDGTADCVDLCPSDPLKIEVGACGCGNLETDSNGNGVPDCADVKTSTVPPRAIVSVRNKRVSVTIPTVYSDVINNVRIEQNGRVIKKLSTRKSLVRITIRNRGQYKVRYTVTSGAIVSRKSKSVSFRVS